jgi:outer membrane protein assembly factor BamE
MNPPVVHRPARASARRLAATAAAALLLATIAGCAGRQTESSGLFAPYRIDLPQGNYVTGEMLDKLRPGMTREQVRLVLGSPLLQPLFRADRWDYVFAYRFASGRTEVRRVAIHFKDDLIATIKADPLPEGDEANDPMLPGGRPAAAARR